jgi:excinuclease ABC subunit A
VCRGDGQIKIEMHFLPDVYVPCEQCHGKRYNKETLDIRFKGKTIADVLDMPVEEAVVFFEHIPKIRRRLETLNAVGLGYIRLGQPATTLSGGEAQRVKLATELSKVATGSTLYILDEPTTGLHFADVERLLDVPAPPGRPGQLGRGHRAQPRRDQDGRPDHRHGPRGGEDGGEVIALRHAGGGRGHAGLVHRGVPAHARRAGGAQGPARHGQAQAARGRDGLRRRRRPGDDRDGPEGATPAAP